MSGGSNIRAIGPGTPAEQPVEGAAEPVEADAVDASESEEMWDYEEEPDPRLRRRWLVPTLAIAATAGWTAAFAWAHRAGMSSAQLDQWVGWIGQWATPVALIALLWLLATRNSRHEAGRFGDVAALLSHESQVLEERLSVINRELSLAREFLASQSRELDSLGRIATERLSEHAGHLQALVLDNGQQVETLATVSTTALENMTRLRDGLPVVANSARDVSNQIGNAGRIANDRVGELVGGFERLNEFGEASERQVAALRQRIDDALVVFDEQVDRIDRMAAERFAALRTSSEDFHAELDGREVETLAALRRRADALAKELRSTHAELETEEEEALVSLRARLGGLRDEAKTIGNSVRADEAAAISLWDGQIEAIKHRLTEAIEVITGIDDSAIASANRKLDALRAEAEKVDRGIGERDERLQTRIAERQAMLEQAEREAADGLAARLAEIDAAIAERREAQIEQTERLGQHGEAIAGRLVELRADIERVGHQGSETEQVLSQSLERLEAKLSDSRAALGGTDEAVAALTEASVRLLELIQASAHQTRHELPASIGEAEGRLASVEERATALNALLGEAGSSGAQLSDYVTTARDTGREAIADMEALHSRFAGASEAHAAQIAGLRAAIVALDEDSSAMAEKARVDLHDAIEALETAARSARAAIGEDAADSIRELAERVGAETSQALDVVIREKSEESIGQLERAAAKASDTSRQAAIQLRDQLAKVDELAGNLETRVTRAREHAEEQVDNDFARRMALITESLNSNAIDIAKALSTDVTDTAWASYLRGDRGIFTRRSVRLLDNGDAREIAELYDGEPEFQENVNRYVADFEGMLRSVLSTRDGGAIGVTLLSSDMGKLYVALAQAIKRLRD
ncbi:ATPase [Pelagerythrobacter sp.]|uniref:ATPase n=1 Tax=Pelagerythrobacter sp. TaxID=2800702 RepID=UPI0035B2F097